MRGLTARRAARVPALALALAVALGTTAAAGCTGPPPPGTQPPRQAEPPTSGLDLTGLDRTVRVQDSLFRFTNGGWLAATEIPPDRADVGTFADLRVTTENEQRALLEQAEAHPDGDLARKVGDFYASFMDTARLDQLRASPLNDDFAAVDTLASPEDLVRYLGTVQRNDITTPINLDVGPDDRDSGINITYVSQADLTLPDRDHYLSGDPKSVGIRHAYRAYLTKMFTLAGTAPAEATAAGAAVLDLETRLAGIHWSSVRNRDPSAIYNKLSVRDAAVRTGFDWAGYLHAAGVNAGMLVIAQPSYFSGLAELVRAVPLASWKSYLRWRLLAAAAPYLSGDFVETRFAFVGTVLGGRAENRERWRRGVTCVNTAMAEALGQLYARRYYPADTHQRVERLVANIVAAFRGSIDNLDWMSPATKAEAQDKLAKMAVKIGHPNSYRDWSALEVRRDDLVGNLRRAADLNYRRQVDKIGKPVDRSEWLITPQTVNATYNPSRNEITFPAGILQPPFFDVRADDAVNYGAIGAIIGHEISHGFDDQGRQYDGVGNLRDWWTPADAKAFTAKTKTLVTRYNGLSPLPGTRVNGRLTLGENIADLSGLTVALRAYQASLAGPALAGSPIPGTPVPGTPVPGTPVPAGTAPVLDGFTGVQRFFLGFARVWRSKEREESLRQDLRNDSHSPGQFRTDAVANNLDEFYAAFEVKPGDRMFLAPEQRIRIW